MNFELTESQRLVRDLCREFAEREVRPRAAEIDRLDEFPWDLYKGMAELEILGMTLPAEYGRLYRDARGYPIWEGTSQIQRLVIARQLLR